MDTQQEKVLKIDLIELLQEIKKKLPMIIIITLLFAAAGYAYKFIYLPPTYTYTRMVKCPARTAYNWYIPDQELLSHVVVFRSDTGNGALWRESAKGRLSDVDLVRENGVATKLIRFQFAGTDPEYIKRVSQQYLESVVHRLNDSFAETTEDEFKHRYYSTTNIELSALNNQFGKNVISSEDIANYLPLLREKLEALEKDNAFLKAKIIEAPSLQPSKVSNRNFVINCAFWGFFLSFGYAVCQYVWQQAKKSGFV